MQQPATRRDVDCLGAGDEASTAAVDRVRETRIVGTVSRKSVDLVDDDEINRMSLHIVEHSLQLETCERTSGSAALDELDDDQRPELVRASLVRLALRRN
nr:hypothetical protein [Humibacter albus]